MKNVITVIVAAYCLVAICQDLSGQSLVYNSYLHNDQQVRSVITPDMLKETKKWKKEEDAPAISPLSAIKLAEREKDRIDRVTESNYDWEIEAVMLVPCGDEIWVWVVRYAGMPKGVNAGHPTELYVAVLMNGKVVESQVARQTKAKSKAEGN